MSIHHTLPRPPETTEAQCLLLGRELGWQSSTHQVGCRGTPAGNHCWAREQRLGSQEV